MGRQARVRRQAPRRRCRPAAPPKGTSWTSTGTRCPSTTRCSGTPRTHPFRVSEHHWTNLCRCSNMVVQHRTISRNSTVLESPQYFFDRGFDSWGPCDFIVFVAPPNTTCAQTNPDVNFKKVERLARHIFPQHCTRGRAALRSRHPPAAASNHNPVSRCIERLCRCCV